MPAVSVQCPHCSQSFSVDSSLVGRKGRCKNCGNGFALTLADDTAASRYSSGDDLMSGPSPTSWSATIPLPEKIGRFLIKERLGAGACGTVYRAVDPTLDRDVALKVPHPELQRDEKAVGRFLREAKAAAKLHHPHVVTVYEAGTDGETSYIASAFIKGRSLADAIDDGPFEPRRAARIVGALADALHAAHQLGIVHRDVKPANILLDSEDRPHLTDFGLARLAASSVKLTKVGSILGTPAYLAPEQARGKSDQAEPASDQYSLGVTLYELLCGDVPFAGPLEVVIFHTLNTPPPPLCEEHPEIPAGLEQVCLKALSKKPQERYASCRELAKDLGRWLAGRTTSLEIPLTSAQPAGIAFDESKPEPAPVPTVPSGSIVLPPMVLSERQKTPRPFQWANLRADARSGRMTARRRKIAAAAAAILIPLLGVILYITTNTGTVEIELSDPNANAVVKVDGATITVDVLREPLKLRVGEHRLEVEGKDFVSIGESFAIKRGEQTIIRFSLVPKAIVSSGLEENRPALASRDRPPEPSERDSLLDKSSTVKSGNVSLERAYCDDIVLAHRFVVEANPDRAVTILANCPAQLRGWEWSYLRGLCERPASSAEKRSRTLRGHGAPIMGLALGPHGLIASGDSWGIVKLWSMPDESCILSIDAETQRIWGISFSPDGRGVACATGAKTVAIWDATTGERVTTMNSFTGEVNQPEFSPVGRHLAATNTDHTVTIFDAKSGRALRSLVGHTATVHRAVFRPDGKRVASSSDDGTVRLWDPETGRELRSYSTGSRWMRGLNYSPDGKRLALAVDDNAFRIMDAEDGRTVLTLTGHSGAGRSVAFSPDGLRTATTGDDRTIKLWHASTGRELLTLAGHTDASRRVVFSPDGRYLVSAGDDRTVKVWDSVGSEADEAPGAANVANRTRIGTPNSSAPVLDDGFRPLFDGKDLSGWKIYPSGTGNWRVEDGRIIGSGPTSHLFTERGDYEDFHFRVEAKINDGGNSGQYFRAEFEPGYPKGYEAQIDSTAPDPLRTGSLYGLVPVNAAPVPPETWFTQEVIARGAHIVIKVDGKTTVDYVDPRPKFRKGHLALQQNHEVTHVEFRKVEIKRLSLASDGPADVASKSFFNAKNLDGWEGLPGYWRLKDGAIVGVCPPRRPAHTFLCSQRTYRDFELRFKARRKDGIGNSGVQFRSRISDRQRFKVIGPQCEIAGLDPKFNPSGSLVTEPSGPSIVADRDQVAAVYHNGDFNDFVIRCEGKHVLIRVNGLATVDGDFPSMPDDGIIAWQMHGRETPREVIFKDISLVELEKTKSDDSFEPLFNGKDLTGWAVESGDGTHFQVRNGEIIAHSRDWTNQNWLLSEKDYSDYILRLEFYLDEGANSGIAVRAEPNEQRLNGDRGVLIHPTFKLADGVKYPKEPLGTMHWVANDRLYVLPQNLADPLSGWNRLEIEVKGNSLRASLNEKVFVDSRLDAAPGKGPIPPGLSRRRGRIGLQAHTGTVRFRDIRIATAEGGTAEPLAKP